LKFNPFYPLREDEVEELAGCLLTSSTMERYVRCLYSSKTVLRLRAELKALQIEGDELVHYAWLYRGYVLGTPARSEAEIPLVAIMATLGQSGIADVERLLMACAASHRPQMTWVASLASGVLASRSGSQIQLQTGVPAIVEAPYSLGFNGGGGRTDWRGASVKSGLPRSTMVGRG
jgi:hypothetical protein